MGQTIPGLLGSCSGKGKGEAGERAPSLVHSKLLHNLQCGVAFAPEKVDGAASVPLREFPGSHYDSSRAFLELGTIGSRLSWDDSPGKGWVEVLLLKIKRPYSFGSGKTASIFSQKSLRRAVEKAQATKYLMYKPEGSGLIPQHDGICL